MSLGFSEDSITAQHRRRSGRESKAFVVEDKDQLRDHATSWLNGFTFWPGDRCHQHILTQNACLFWNMPNRA